MGEKVTRSGMGHVGSAGGGGNPAKPEPAPGQLWSRNGGAPWQIRDVVDRSWVCFDDGGKCTPLSSTLQGSPRWRCVGIETPAGRVMVGERRRGPFTGPSEVVAVAQSGHAFEVTAGITTTYGSAEVVASWPLVTEPASPPTVSDLLDGSPKWAKQTVRGSFIDTASGPWLDALAGGERRGDETDEELRERLLRRMGAEPQKAAPDPRAEREARRREIDAALREDARRWPAFATARRCAVLAACEGREPSPMVIGQILSDLHAYERWSRDGSREPSAAALAWVQRREYGPEARAALAAYERARALP